MIVPDGESKSPRDFVCPITLVPKTVLNPPKRTYFSTEKRQSRRPDVVHFAVQLIALAFSARLSML